MGSKPKNVFSLQQNSEMTKKHLLLDLGQVLLPLSEENSIKAFTELTASEELLHQKNLFESIERGEISPEDFRAQVQKHLWRRVYPGEIDAAWNALVLEMDPEVINWLKRMKRKYSIHLVSNINVIHHQYIKQAMGPFAYNQFMGCFENTFLSYEMGTRKPEPEFFEKVLETIGCEAEECLFVDDREDNLEAALAMGIEGTPFTLEEGTILDLDKVLSARHS